MRHRLLSDLVSFENFIFCLLHSLFIIFYCNFLVFLHGTLAFYLFFLQKNPAFSPFVSDHAVRSAQASCTEPYRPHWGSVHMHRTHCRSRAIGMTQSSGACKHASSPFDSSETTRRLKINMLECFAGLGLDCSEPFTPNQPNFLL